jgi:hypothetical protein
MKDIVSFFHTVNIGDMLWISNVSYFLVQGKAMMTPGNFNSKVKLNMRTTIKGTVVTILTIKDKNGKVLNISPDFFRRKALYKERPRTYKELNI